MPLTCPTCRKKFNTNAGLYAHKEQAHKKPSVILVSHDKHNDSDKRKEMTQSDSENDDFIGFLPYTVIYAFSDPSKRCARARFSALGEKIEEFHDFM